MSVREQQTDRHVVVPDLHGEYHALELIVDEYFDEEDITFVFLGDILDRKGIVDDPEKGVFRTLDIIKNLGERAIVAVGNHEWRLLASLQSVNSEQKKASTFRWLGRNAKDGVERNVLCAYDVDRFGKENDQIMSELKRKMSLVGHFAIIASVTPYFETDSFIAIHAGLDPAKPWEEQRDELMQTSAEMSMGEFSTLPPQWFSMELATNTDIIAHTEKTVLSGHAHRPLVNEYLQPITKILSERALHGGKKVRLASELNHPNSGSNVYVWQDWNNQIVPLPIYSNGIEASAAD